MAFYFAVRNSPHALWDTKLVSKLAPAKSPGSLTALLQKDCSVDLFKTPGDYHEWPAKWVSDAAKEAIGAYESLGFGVVSLKPDGKIDRIETVKPADYDAQQLPRVKLQLEKSAVRLAQLLNSVKWKCGCPWTGGHYSYRCSPNLQKRKLFTLLTLT